MKGRRLSAGFTLIELMIVVVILGVLVAIAVTQYANMLNRSQDAYSKGNLAVLRSAIRIYYSDTERFPTDNLSILITGDAHLREIPRLKTAVHKNETKVVTTEVIPTEVETWSYDNVEADEFWGRVHVGCLHEDSRGVVWTTY